MRQDASLNEYIELLTTKSNWGRWGADDELGTVNLITPEKRVAAARMVRSGRTVSLGRNIPTLAAAGIKKPAQHLMTLWGDDEEGGAEDYIAMVVHGPASTHLDAIGHGWQRSGAWNGRKPTEIVSFGGGFKEPGQAGRQPGLLWGAVHQMASGIVTRGVFLNVPKFRGTEYVVQEEPVHGWELEKAAVSQGVTVSPGDALVVYSGRERWSEFNPVWGSDPHSRPGLHASCLEYLRDSDCSILVWDMHDARPSGFDNIEFAVHAALSAFGLPLVDHALLEPLADACEEESRYEFLLTVSPLNILGGTGSPVNPIAVF